MSGVFFDSLGSKVSSTAEATGQIPLIQKPPESAGGQEQRTLKSQKGFG
jgi:hypothetical protein